MDIYNILIAACWAIFLTVWFIGAFGTTPTQTANLGKRVAARLGGVLLILLLFALPPINNYFRFIPAKDVNPVLGWTSVALATIGVGIAIWARVYLGRNWGMPKTLRQEHELVTSGPYRYVRHPIYTGVLIAILGAVVLQGIIWLIVLGYFVYYFSRSAHTEEGHMLERFPDSYPAYISRTKKFIPFIF